MPNIEARALERLIAAIFGEAGCARNEAEAIGTRLVSANLSGHDSHGVVRVPRYVDYIDKGQVKIGQSIERVVDSAAFALVDGRYGFGQVIGEQAVRLGLEKARDQGVSVIGLRHSAHLGRIGDWAELACDEGFASIHFVNVINSRLVAAFGGRERRISTAPFAVGVPNRTGFGDVVDDFILDFATSQIAEGKALVAVTGGKKVPPGSLVDGKGEPTDDPTVLYGAADPGANPDPNAGPGALAPMGMHKGSGLAMACELLAGALTGAGTCGPADGLFCNNMLSIYVDPDRMDESGAWRGIVEDYVGWVRDCRPRDPTEPVMIAGDPERRRRAERLAGGVPLSDATWEAILAAGESRGLGRNSLLAIASPMG